MAIPYVKTFYHVPLKPSMILIRNGSVMSNKIIKVTVPLRAVNAFKKKERGSDRTVSTNHPE